ncbi:hypothetical protein J2Z32_002328 [Paenibacillus turicensis]|uniref:Uncharacterized protein n=1 Tax=Paenibacillus turicensis TaxID=160487 RepID=A0ABS4FT04_9BACL|nr:hypothetical protein [Paenibacillus turicensis]MBP1905680.1 hypothetical protein [Paenibacillus turicensis]
MNLTPDEQALIEHLRTLTFYEVIDATFAIDSAMTRARRLEDERKVNNILTLSVLITNASEAYKKEASILDQD